MSAVVTDAVRRWFVEASKEASNGDVVSKFAAFHLLSSASFPRY